MNIVFVVSVVFIFYSFSSFGDDYVEEIFEEMFEEIV
jgi:hypothetical protein